jgi:hypothetical protein
MAVDGTREPTLTAEGDQPPAALFKNSLRTWQARWKSQQPPQASETPVARKIRPRTKKKRKPR